MDSLNGTDAQKQAGMGEDSAASSRSLQRAVWIRLHPNEWRSGEAIWIVDAVGERKAVQRCIEGLTKTAFHGKQLKMLQSPRIG